MKKQCLFWLGGRKSSVYFKQSGMVLSNNLSGA